MLSMICVTALVVGTLLASTLAVRLPAVPAIIAGQPAPSASGVAVAPDHSVWIGMIGSGSIVHVAGHATTVVTTSRDQEPFDIVPLPDGRVLFNEFGPSMTGQMSEPIPRIGCVAPRGTCASISLPRPFVGVDSFVVNRFGQIAVIDTRAAVYGRRTVAGIQVYNPPAGYFPNAIAVADDGAFWFALSPKAGKRPGGSGLLVRIDRMGRMTQKAIPANESILLVASNGQGIVYAAGTPSNHVLFRFVAYTAEAGIVPGPPLHVQGDLSDFVVQDRRHVWIVLNSALGTLRELDVTGAVRTVQIPELRGQVISGIAADGGILWCATPSNRLFAFDFSKLARAYTNSSRKGV